MKEKLSSVCLKTVSYNERETLKCMLKDFDVQMIEELLDVISEYKCFSNPTAQNLKTLLVEFAHVQLIQNPKYISACFGEIFSKHSIFSNVEEIMLTYEEKVPTVKRVLKCLNLRESANPRKKEIFQFLKKYIKTLNMEKLKLFLQFVTGSDNMPT